MLVYYDRSVVQISQCYYYYMLPSPQFCWWLAVVLTKNNDECWELANNTYQYQLDLYFKWKCCCIAICHCILATVCVVWYIILLWPIVAVSWLEVPHGRRHDNRTRDTWQWYQCILYPLMVQMACFNPRGSFLPRGILQCAIPSRTIHSYSPLAKELLIEWIKGRMCKSSLILQYLLRQIH